MHKKKTKTGAAQKKTANFAATSAVTQKFENVRTPQINLKTLKGYSQQQDNYQKENVPNRIYFFIFICGYIV